MNDDELLTLIAGEFSARRPEHFTDDQHCCECAEHDEVLSSRELHTLTLADIGNPGWDPICFVTDEAFLYLFPALARIALEAPRADRAWYMEQFLFHLIYDGPQNRRLLVASAAQRNAVAALLRHVEQTRTNLVDDYLCRHDLEQALSIWSADG